MELKEYIRIIKQNKALFLGAWLAVILVCLSWWKTRPVSYDVAMSIEVARQGTQSGEAYQYDQYYRLEADSKFAETVVQWLKDPAIANAVLQQSEVDSAKSLKKLAKTFRAEKLSSTYLQVRFSVNNPASGEKVSKALTEILKGKVTELNNNNANSTWFSLVFGKPIIAQAKISGWVVGLVAIIGGFGLAVLATLIRHYWKD